MIVAGDGVPSGDQGHYRSIAEALEARSLRAHSDLAALQVSRSRYTEDDRQAVAAFAAQIPAWDALLKTPDTLMAVDASGTPIAKASPYVDQHGHYDIAELTYRDTSRETVRGCTPQVLPPSQMVAFLPVVPAASFGHDNLGAPPAASALGLPAVR